MSFDWLNLDWKQFLCALFAGMVAVTGWGLKIRKQKPADDVDIAVDHGTRNRLVDLIKASTADREKRIENEVTIGELKAENRLLKHDLANSELQIKLLERRVKRLEQMLGDENPHFKKFISSRAGDLDDEPKP